MNMDITQYIDLESYSSTPGFLGYTDNAPDFSEAGIDALCDDFLKKNGRVYQRCDGCFLAFYKKQ